MARKTPSPYKSLCISNPLKTKQHRRKKKNIIEGEEGEEMVDEAWERAVEAALHAGGEGSSSPARSLTLDGAVKCMHGRLPAAEILERHQSLEHLSIAGIGVTSLEGFPRLRNLTRLTLSDNRIAGGLDHLVAAGLSSLRDLDLSNNRIQDVDDLAPLADLRLVSLDLYECPVTRVKDYRSRVFGMIRTLKYLDKMDADENERPESDDDDDDGEGEAEGEGDGDGDGDEDDDDEDDEDDPGSGEVANGGVSHSRGGVASHLVEVNGVIDVDEEESDADEVVPNGGVEHHHGANGFRVAVAGEAPDEEDEDVEDDDEDEDDEDFDDEEDLGEEIDEDGDDEDAVVEVHDVPSTDEDEDGVEEDEDEEDDEEEVEDEGEEAEPQSSGRVAMMTGEDGEEIDGHEHGEGDDEDENGEIGEEDDEGLEGDGVYVEGNDDEDADDEVYTSIFLQTSLLFYH
jgi:acidic leucine-rich nuclear phosphoprotein 32 family protein B